MAETYHPERILSILYEMALTIGSEEQLDPLATRTLQRLLYHTGFPCGLLLLAPYAEGITPAPPL